MAPARNAFLGLLLLAALPTQGQVPPQILKPLATKVAEKLLKPKMQVERFTLGGFEATRVDPDGDATPEAFSGNALFQLPPPLGPRKLEFKGLVLKGTLAEGGLEADLKEVEAEHLGWIHRITKVALSDKGSRVEGTASLAGLVLDLGTLALTPQGLSGTLNPGDLALAEGPFTALLKEGSATFTPTAIRLGGALAVMVAPPVHHGLTGAPLAFDGGSVAFDSRLLADTGTVAAALAKDVLLGHKGLRYRIPAFAFGFERGTPILSGSARLEFPLNVFCRVGATDQPYLSEPAPCQIRGRAPAPEAPRTRGLAPRPALPLALAWEGFSATFPLAGASLHPSGLTRYHLQLERGSARVSKGALDPEGTRLTGTLTWGPTGAFQTAFADAPAGLSRGLYVKGSPLTAPAEVGAYRLYPASAPATCDFSEERSPEGLPEGWMGVHLPAYHLALPAEVFTFNSANHRLPVLVPGQDGRFEGNAAFSGALAVNLEKLVNLHFVPVRLEPFELQFLEGALLQGPVVAGTLDLTAEPLLKDFRPPFTFHLTQNGVEQVEINTQTPEGPRSLDTYLTGVRMVVESARLHPTNLDFTGRFEFAIEGVVLPPVAFDHLVLEASGGGIDGNFEDPSLDFKGSRWAAVADQPHVNLWGYPLGLMENGYGVLADGRFYVGLGGDIEINPLIPTLYNRLLFTTLKGTQDQPAVELEKPYEVDQTVAALGSLKASLGFQVETAGDAVSDAYFLGDGSLKVNVGSTPFGLDAGFRFGRRYQGASSFPYFYALGHFQAPKGGVPVAPNLEVFGLAGGLAQNFLPDDLRSTQDIQGKPDPNIGLAVMAGVDAGTSDQFTFHGELSLFISQNLTTVLQGEGWLFCDRSQKPADNRVSADLRLTRNPDVFDAVLEANLSLQGGLLRPMGRVELHFGPDRQFVHIGTREAPITVRFLNAWDGWGYMTADFEGGGAAFGAGGGVTYRKTGGFGPLYGEAWLTAQGDLLIEIDAARNPRFLGTLSAEGGASFGMKFKTWKTHKITIFSGSLATNLAFQVPGSPTFSGNVTLRYRVLGGLFKGSVTAHLDL